MKRHARDLHRLLTSRGFRVVPGNGHYRVEDVVTGRLVVPVSTSPRDADVVIPEVIKMMRRRGALSEAAARELLGREPA